MTDIEALKALLANATPGEWCEIGGDDCLYASEQMMRDRHPMAHFVKPDNRKAIAALHNAAPALIERMEKAEAERDELRARVAVLEEVLLAGKADRWAATVGSDGKPYPFGPSEWVVLAEDAIAATPAQSLAKLKADTLRDCLNSWPNIEGGRLYETSLVAWLIYSADRLEQEAVNG